MSHKLLCWCFSLAVVGCAESAKQASSSVAAQAEEAPSRCATFANKARECLPGMGELSNAVACEGPDHLLECGQRSGCAEFSECVSSVRAQAAEAARARAAGNARMALLPDLAEGRWEDALEQCAQLGTLADDVEVAPLCARAAALGYAALTQSLEAARDGLSSVDRGEDCDQLEQLAAPLGHARLAERLCDEVAAVALIRSAEDAVKIALRAAATHELPVECELAMTRLAALDTPWSTLQHARLAKACREELPKRVAQSAKKALLAIRDSRTRGEIASHCRRLSELSTYLSETDNAAHKHLCREAAIAYTVGAALTDAARAMEQGTDYLPLACRTSLTALSQLGGEWAADQKQVLVDKCLVELGGQLLRSRVPRMAHICDPAVAKLVETLDTHAVRHANLDAWVEKARPLCPRADYP